KPAQRCPRPQHHRQAPPARPGDGPRRRRLRRRRADRRRAARPGAAAELRHRPAGARRRDQEPPGERDPDRPDREGRARGDAEERVLAGLRRREQGGQGQDAPDRTPAAAGLEARRAREGGRGDRVAVPLQGPARRGQGQQADRARGGRAEPGDRHPAHRPRHARVLRPGRRDPRAGPRRAARGDHPPTGAGGDRAAGPAPPRAGERGLAGTEPHPREHEDGRAEERVLRAAPEEARRAGDRHREAPGRGGRPSEDAREAAPGAGDLPRRVERRRGV
ncbi:MAG: hypothetical protein AVDCRST_MAG64-880, partial [uncultured Phycisphaerae bacterium]